MRQPFSLDKEVAEHSVEIRQNIIVPVANDGDTLLGKPGCSTIVRLLAQLRVLAAIDFNDKAQLRAIEIDGIWSNRMLPSET